MLSHFAVPFSKFYQKRLFFAIFTKSTFYRFFSRRGFLRFLDNLPHDFQEFAVHLGSSDAHAVHLDRRADQDFLLGKLRLDFSVQDSRNLEEDKVCLALVNAAAELFEA